MYITYILIVLTVSSIKSVPSLKHTHIKDLNKERVSFTDTRHYENDRHNTEFDHEAILGSVHEAEEFDNLPPEESRRRLRILLNKMDLNSNQLIEKNELKAWIIRSFKSLTKEEAQERFDEIDANKDGLVTWREFMLESFGTDEEQDASDDSNKLLYYDRLMFIASDKNNDEMLTISEFEIFNAPEEYDSTLPIVLNQTLDEKDADGNGVLDFQEYVGESASNEDKDWLIAEKEKFDAFDRNKNGFLEAAEMLKWIVPNDEETAEEEVTHLFFESDDNDDGVLSVEEILDHHDIFVGSEATDYGDQLVNIEHEEL